MSRSTVSARHARDRVWWALALGLLVSAAGSAAELTPPRLSKFVEVSNPSGFEDAEVDVVLQITILESGLPGEITIDRSGGDPWDQIALEAAQQFVFEPALEDGVPVAVRVPFTYRFRPMPRRGPFATTRFERRRTEATPGARYEGLVLEKGTRTPLDAITVELIDPKTQARRQAVTDSEGRFIFEGLPTTPLQLEIVTGEHEPVSTSVKPSLAATEPSPAVYLDPVGAAEYLTVVKDRPPPAVASQVTLREDELRRTPGTFGDPTRVVQTLPGVARSPFGLGFYAVRGSSFENTGFFIDGHPALFLYHLLGGPGILAPDLVGQLDFYPGGYPVKYGRFATGAVVVTTKDPPDDRWHADVEIDLLKATGVFSIPFQGGRGIATVSFRRSYYELILPLVNPDVSLSYLDYQARVTYAITPDVKFRFIALGAEDRFGQSGANEDTGEERSSDFVLGFHRLLTEVEWTIQPGLDVESSLLWEHDRNNVERTSEDDDTITADFAGYFFSWRNEVNWRPSKTLLLSGGVDSFFSDLGASLRIPSFSPVGDPRPPIFDPIIVSSRLSGPFNSADPWISLDWEVAPGLRVIPGMRATLAWYGDGLKAAPDPRMSIRWEFVPGWTMTAMGALSHEVPAPFQYLEPYGDPEIPLTRGAQGSFGFEWMPGDGWLVKIEGYYNHLFNMVRPAGSNSVGDDGNVDQGFWASDMQGRGYGLEVFIRKEFGGRHYGWVSYTLARAERLRPPTDWVLYEGDQTHNLNVAWSVILGRDWSVGARFTLTSGNFYQPIVGARYDADRDSYEPIYALESERFDVYHRLDLRLDKRWRFDTWMMEVYLDIQNVYNASNPETQRYSYDYRLKTEGAGIPILPTIGVRGVF